MAESANTTSITGSRSRPIQYAGAPSSGTSGTFAGLAAAVLSVLGYQVQRTKAKG